MSKQEVTGKYLDYLTQPTDKSGGFLLQRDRLTRRQVLHLLHKRYGKIVCRGFRVSLGTV